MVMLLCFHWNLVFVMYAISKFIYILWKFYSVRSFDYSWNNNLIMFFYKRNICFILQNLILFCYWATFQWTSVRILTKLFQCCFLNIEALSINIRWCRLTCVDSTFFFNQILTLKIVSLTLNWRNSFNVV